jgi:hypothetical protein
MGKSATASPGQSLLYGILPGKRRGDQGASVKKAVCAADAPVFLLCECRRAQPPGKTIKVFGAPLPAEDIAKVAAYLEKAY